MKTIKLKIRNTALAIFIIASFNATAQDVISYTWQTEISPRDFVIKATQGETFSIDWGDNSDIEIGTGTGNGNNEQVRPRHTYTTAGTYNVTITANSTDCRFTYFDCKYRQLTSLDVSNCGELTSLGCGYNQLTSLNINGCTALTFLSCNINQLTSLDVSNNTELTYLVCSDNQLTSLNLSNNTELTQLYCEFNLLTGLDISNNIALYNLQCSYNQLTALDISNNTLLKYLVCADNQLSELDLSNNPKLEYLDCADNQLSELDLRNNALLRNILCYNNHIPLSDLYAASQTVSYYENKHLGTQTLQPLTVLPNTELFAEQSEFGGIFTNYTVIKNGSSAPASDYTVTDGKITFHTLGTYTVTMTNAAIISHTNYPAKVVVEITVSDITITNSQFGTMNCVVYPNPTKSMVFIEYDFRKNFDAGYELLFEAMGKKADKDCGKGTVRVYNLSGILLNSSTLNEVRGLEVINIETYPTGTYLIEVSDCYGNTNSVKVIKN